MPNYINHGPTHSAFGGDPAPSMLTPDLGIELMDHFIQGNVTGGNLAAWSAAANGGTIGADFTQAAVPQYNAHGVLKFTSGTTPTTNRATYTLGPSGPTNLYGSLALAQGPLILMARIRLNETPQPADCAATRIGFWLDDGAGTQQNGIYALYDPVVSPYWSAANLKATVLTSDASGLVSGTTDNFVWVKLSINAAWTSATVRVNGQNAGTITINMAAAFINAPIIIMMQKKVGSTNNYTMYLDALYMRYLWNAPQPS
jgi:hypothetical protein